MPTSRQEDTGDLQVLLDRDLAQVLLDLQLAASCQRRPNLDPLLLIEN